MNNIHTQVINFSADDVATFIAVIGVLSVTAQTLILAFLYNWLGKLKADVLSPQGQTIRIITSSSV